MRRFIRVAVLGIVAALLVCIAVFALGRSTPRPAAPAQPARGDATTRAPDPTAIPRGYLSKALLGDKWPLTVDEGTIVCDRQAILFRDPTGQLYAVNGIALAQVGHLGWRDIHDIDIPTPNEGAGTIISLQPLLDVGLALCR